MELTVPGALQFCNSIYQHVEAEAVPDVDSLLVRAQDLPAGAFLQATHKGQTYLIQDGEIYAYSHKVCEGVDWSKQP